MTNAREIRLGWEMKMARPLFLQAQINVRETSNMY